MRSAIGLRHPASASCLGRHLRLAGRCPNNSSLFPPLAAVVVVALCAYSAEKLFLIEQCRSVCGRSGIAFSREGVVTANGSCRACFLRKRRRGGQASCWLNPLSQNLTVLTAPSEREPLARPQTLRLSRKLYRYAKGPIPEDDFPRPGEDVTAGDKKGNLAARSDGWGSFSTDIFSSQIACIPSKLLKNARFFVR